MNETINQSKEVLLTATEAAKILGVSTATVRRAIRDGIIRARNVSFGLKRPTYKIPKSELNKVIAQLNKIIE